MRLAPSCCFALAATTRQRQGRTPAISMVLRASQVFGSVPEALSATDKIPRTLSFDAPPAEASPEALAVFTAALLGVALYLGPDVWLAALGLESGKRPGRATELFYGRLLNETSPFVAEATDGYAAEPPLNVRLATGATYVSLGGALTYALVVLFGFDDVSFVFAASTCAVIAGCVYEVGRPKIPTRFEAEQKQSLKAAFIDFADARLQRTPGPQSVHKSEIIAAFRRSVARYRTADASGVSDAAIEKIARRWLYASPVPGNLVTPVGFFKGIVLTKEPEIF